MTETERAWCAGFMDGEGSFGVTFEQDKRRGTANPRPALQVTNTHLESIHVIQKRFFGYGNIVTPKKDKPNHKQQYRLAIRKALHIVRVVHLILPYLVTKHAVAEQLLAFCISRSSVRGKGRYAPFTESELRMVKRLSKLNKRGI